MALDIFKSYNRKVAAQLAAEATVAARRQDDADALAVKQLNDIRKTVPVALPPELEAALPPKADVAKVGKSAKWIFAGVAVLLVGGYIWSRR